MRLLIVQYAGDYREAFQRLAEGGDETYYAQKYSIDAVTEIRQRVESATVICCLTETPYDEVLANGVRAIGAGFHQQINVKKLIELIAEQQPTHLVVRTPIREVFTWAREQRVRTIGVFAESVSTSASLRSKLRNFLLANLLNHRQIEWVATYGITSSLLFQKIGVKPEKIIPWDFLLDKDSGSLSHKTLQDNGKTWQLFYAGLLVPSKGVGDILLAVANLKKRGILVKLKIAGKGEKEFFVNLAEQLQIQDCVEFIGTVPTHTLEPLMRESDIILVASRHEYPEGFPLTIHHALRSRTPIVASDHPMFKTNLKHGINAMIFEAGNSVALAKCIEKLLSDSALYNRLSAASSSTWDELRLPVKWADPIERWLDDSPESKQWLFEHRLASGRYNTKIL
jgi:glycosyltransferase involved in cell wall biosynthesis